MAHKKAGSSSKNGRDSVGQRLGVKVGDGVLVSAGAIIVRQRGMTFLSGEGTGLGRDYTVFATTAGRVRFEHQARDKKRIRVEADVARMVTEFRKRRDLVVSRFRQSLPGAAFGDDRWVRLSYAAATPDINRALDRIVEFATKLAD